jgi:hypothetical protein
MAKTNWRKDDNSSGRDGEAGWPNAQVAAAGPAKHLQACLVF